MRDPAELKEIFKKLLGTDWVGVTVRNDAVTVRAREVGWLDKEMLEDIEANGFFIENWFFDIAGGGTFVAHLMPEEGEE